MNYKFKQWLESVHVVAFLVSVIAVAMIIAAMTNDKGAYDVLPAVVPFFNLSLLHFVVQQDAMAGW